MTLRSCLLKPFLGAPVVLGAAAAVLMLAATPAVRAETGSHAADRLVKEALHREIYGLHAERDKLLREALQADPRHPAALWLTGHVKYNNRWIPIEEAVELAQRNSLLKRYAHERAKRPPTVAGHLAMAAWCAKKKLPQQRRAHLQAVLAIDPDHAAARAQLGFVRVGFQWLTAAEIRQARAEAIERRRGLVQWTPKLVKLRVDLLSESGKARRRATERLFEIRSPDAIPALQSVLAPASEELALLVVELLARMDHQEASLSLARLAVISPWDTVRLAAARKLKSRDDREFVPAMLSGMQSLVQRRSEIVRGRGGRLVYRQAFFREGQEANQLAVLETAYRRVAAPNGSGADTLGRVIETVQQREVAGQTALARQNAQREAMNTRIMQALVTITGAEVFPASPESWWQWWNEHNEVYIEGEKPLQQVVLREQINVADRVSVDSSTGEVAITGRGSMPLDCLAAGTPVWTLTGPQPIEEIRVGDLVLSQNIETGELAFKPVLRTTVRPESPLVRIETDQEVIETSGGHPFWVSGAGWVKARMLKQGNELHGVTSTSRISSVETSRREKTYNLVVADFNNYFVGEKKILCHDNTIREASPVKVPGLRNK